MKWSDDVYQPAGTIRRTTSLSPNWSAPSNHLKNSSSFDDFYNLYKNYNNGSNDSTNTMSYYGNTGYMNRGRDNQFPPYSTASNYQSYGKHPVYLLYLLKFVYFPFSSNSFVCHQISII